MRLSGPEMQKEAIDGMIYGALRNDHAKEGSGNAILSNDHADRVLNAAHLAVQHHCSVFRHSEHTSKKLLIESS